MTAGPGAAEDGSVTPWRTSPEGVAGPWRGTAERLAVAGGLLAIAALALGLRLVPVLFVPSMNWGDEVFQTVEPAHRLVYGYGLMTWEFQLGMRSWLLPGALAGLIEVGRLFGDGPQAYLAAVAVGLGLLALAPVVCAFLWGRRRFGPAAGLVAALAVAAAPELVYFGARALNEIVAAHVLVIALYLALPGERVEDRRRLFAAGVLLGLVSLLRLQLAPAAALVALWAGWRGAGWHGAAWHGAGRRLPAIIGGGVAAVAAGAVLDWLSLGYPLASVWRNLFFNLHLGVSSGFSVEPWHYYLLGELGVWLAGAPFLLLLIGIGARRQPLLLAAALTILATHMAVPHKEYRFIYPGLVLLMLLAAGGLAELTARAAGWASRPGLRRPAALLCCALLASAAWGAMALNAWSNGALALLRHRDHDELMAIAFARRLPAICGVGFLGEDAWVRYGGYAHLHRPVPLFWPKDEEALAATAAGFDTLIADRPPPDRPPSDRPSPDAPAASLGFRTERCFGEVCVARRTGGCESRPAPPVWFPEQVRGKVPTGTRLEALPAAPAAPR